MQKYTVLVSASWTHYREKLYHKCRFAIFNLENVQLDIGWSYMSVFSLLKGCLDTHLHVYARQSTC